MENGKNEINDYPTFSKEDNLPSLPLPSLKSTLTRYFESVKPFVNEDDYENTRKIIENFEQNEGVKLQSILNDRAKATKNWVNKN